MKVLGLIIILGMLSVIAVVFELKHNTEQEAANVANLQREIDSEKERISLLKAEHSALSQPGRIQGLVEKHPDHLPLAHLKAEQIIKIEDLPEKPVQIEDFIDGHLLGLPDHAKYPR